MFPRFENLTPEHQAENAQLLSRWGADSAENAVDCLTELARLSQTSPAVGEAGIPPWYDSLCRLLRETADPLCVLEAVVSYVRATPDRAATFAGINESPRSLDILARLATGSPFLTGILLRDPQLLPFLTQHRRAAELKSREQFLDEAVAFAEQDSRPPLVAIRDYQRREQLRVGLCDVFGLLGLQYVTLQLSLLADAMVGFCLQLACQEHAGPAPPLAVLALGKHGGEELNYSSDIDLVLLAESSDRSVQQIARRLVDGLNEHLTTGFLYRVDLRLRPWGNAGPLVTSPEAWRDYLQQHAQLWEKQALLKARVVAGDTEIGRRLLDQVPDLLFSLSADEVRTAIRAMKQQIEIQLDAVGTRDTEVKLGAGSIRDVEFLVQSLQLMHGHQEPRVASANTLDALVRLAEFSLLPAGEYQQLRDGYVFLRTVEHALQLQHNQQTHLIPDSDSLRHWLALRVDYPDADAFMQRFHEHRQAVRRIFNAHFDISDPGAVPAESGGRPDHSPLVDKSSLMSLLDNRLTGLLQQRTAAEVRSSVWLAEVRHTGPDSAELVFVADARSELAAAVSAVLFACGMDIRSGQISSRAEALPSAALPEQKTAGIVLLKVQPSEENRQSLLTRLAEDVDSRMLQVMMVARSGRPEVLRSDLLSLFCERMLQLDRTSSGRSELNILHQSAEDSFGTVFEITASDSPGFLFELSNALDLCGFQIREASIDVVEGEVCNRFLVTERNGASPLSPTRTREVLTAVSLIYQLTLWLPSQSDPARVLSRFRRFLQQLLSNDDQVSRAAALRAPQVLSRVARVLSLSRYLWEFALQQPTELIDLLAEPESLQNSVSPQQLRQAFEVLTSTGQAMEPVETQRLLLGQVTHASLCRAELRHVLGYCREFGEFSQEITRVAEMTLHTAAEVAWQQLQNAGDLQEAWKQHWVLAGLGKFGGVEMGYASDIELLLVYDDDATGPEAARGFEKLLHTLTELVERRQDGIFQIDLRMRPWGQAGSAAVSLSQFRNYYGGSGSAWPWERQALVKLRSLPGNAIIAESVQRLRDQLIYDGRRFEFDAMVGLREQQLRQYVPAGTTHAKLSEGCLVDCEYSVQALQLTFGDRHPVLRTGNTLHALQAAHQLSLVPDALADDVQAACIFLRQLIDCLRMVRGNARDLLVPPAGSADAAQLDLRLRSIYGNQVSLDLLRKSRDSVREFAAQVRTICHR